MRLPTFVPLRQRRIHYGIAYGIPHGTPSEGGLVDRPFNTTGPHTNSIDAFASLNSPPVDTFEIEGFVSVYPSFTFTGYPTITMTGPDLELATSCLYLYVQYRGTSAPELVVYNECTGTNIPFAINSTFESDYLTDLSGAPFLSGVLYMQPVIVTNGDIEEVELRNWSAGTFDVIATYTATAAPSGLITGSRALEENHGNDSAYCRDTPTLQMNELLYQYSSNDYLGYFTPSNATLSYSGACTTLGGTTSPYDSFSLTETSSPTPQYGYQLTPH